MKPLKEYSDDEICMLVRQALEEIRKESPNQYGEIRITVSGGKLKFLTVEKPIVLRQG